MKNLKKKRRIQIIIILIISLAISSILIGYGLRDGISYFKSPTDLTNNPPSSTKLIRIGGLVEVGSLLINSNGGINFKVTDGNKSVLVSYSGILPDLFSEGQGMIGKGYFKSNLFVAKEILAKHDEKYMPIEVIDVLKEQGVFKSTTVSD
ncbi:MAG: cytochrome c maturation protein CcmE [Paracoccaceae bacterium]